VDPSLRISEVPVLDEQERFHLLFECNKTVENYPRHLSLPQLFDQQAARTPAAIAIVDDTHVLSYPEVERRSNALAARLLKRGIGPVRESASLRAAGDHEGGECLCSTGSRLSGRLAQIVEQSNLSGVVARSPTFLPELSTTVPIVAIDEGSGEDEEEAGAAALPPIVPDDTAYVIFTSGSTGRPKGVQIPHRAVPSQEWLKFKVV
jgi:non-ribosomal peptide synthetase component F